MNPPTGTTLGCPSQEPLALALGHEVVDRGPLRSLHAAHDLPHTAAVFLHHRPT